MSAVERSMDESSISDASGGQLPDREQKATTINVAERNARIMLQGVGKTLAESVVQFGDLMADCIINHMTIPQIVELGSGNTKIKYKTFVLNNKNVGDKKVSKTIKFDESLLGREMTDKQKTNEEMKMLESIGYPKEKKSLIRVNPEMFARFKYLSKVVPETMFPRNEEYMQALMSQMYTQFRQDPLIKADSLVRKTLYWFFRGDAEDMMVDTTQMPQMPQMPENLLGPEENKEKTNVSADIIKKTALAGGQGRTL
jgi:hypothetical protein